MNWSKNHCLQDVDTNNHQEQLDPAADLKVQRLEKQIQELQDYTEDLTFKAQRHEETSASLCSQNAFLVKKCSDLQRQLIECLSTVDVLDIRCNDAESKLKRVRLALEEKELALLTMSGQLSAALLKIEENEREMKKVQTEMDNVNRKFMKVSCNQRELREDLLFYKNILKARDQKIQKLLEDRSRVSTCLEDLKAQRTTGVTCTCRSNALEAASENDQCEQLMKNISAGDDLLTEKMLMLKSDNARLATQVSSLNDELGNRCASDALRMNQILEKIGNVEDDIVSFLTLLEKEAKQCPTQVKPNMREEVAGDNSDLMQDLAKTKEEAATLRLANSYLEKLIKIQVSSLGTIFQKAGQEVIDLKEKISRRKFDCCLQDQGEGPLIRSNSAEQQEMSNLLEMTSPVSASQLKNELEHNLVDESIGEESVEDFFRTVDFLCVSQICPNAYEELFRLSVLLQVCLLKMKSIVPEERQYYLPIMSGLKGALLKIRSTISTYESVKLKGTEDEDCTVVTLPLWMYYGASEGEPNPLAPSATEQRTQLATYRNNRFMSKEVLATTETEARVRQKRHQIYQFHKSHVRLRNGDSSWLSNVAREDNKVIPKLYPGGQHQVCTDLVINLQRNLRSSERNNLKLQEKLCAKTKEVEKLQQEISNLRVKLEAVHDTLDNKKIALGRSEAIWQMLRVSEASLEQRLEFEQRQHEDCRQQVDKLAASLEEMRIKCAEREVSRDDWECRQDAASTTLSLPPPAPRINRAELGNLPKHSNEQNGEIIRLMDDCVSLMMNDLNLLQRHFAEKQNDNPP